MSQRPDEAAVRNRVEIAEITNDLEAASLTVMSLIKLAERTLAAEEAGAETLVQVAGRYAADIALITQRLIKANLL